MSPYASIHPAKILYTPKGPIWTTLRSSDLLSNLDTISSVIEPSSENLKNFIFKFTKKNNYICTCTADQLIKSSDDY